MTQIIQNEKKVIDLADSPYLKTYEAILRLEEAVRGAKSALLLGESPYVILQFIQNIAGEAKTEWHIAKDREDNDTNNSD